MYRWHQDTSSRYIVDEAKNVLARGALGRISYAMFSTSHFLPGSMIQGWRRLVRDTGGGALMDSGSHLIHEMLYLTSTSVFSLRVPHGEQAQALVSNVEGRIDVALMDDPTVGTDPDAIGQGQGLVLVAAGVAKPGGRVPPVHGHDVRPRPQALVLQLASDQAQGGIVYALGQLGSRKSLHAQILDAHHVMVLE